MASSWLPLSVRTSIIRLLLLSASSWLFSPLWPSVPYTLQTSFSPSSLGIHSSPCLEHASPSPSTTCSFSSLKCQLTCCLLRADPLSTQTKHLASYLSDHVSGSEIHIYLFSCFLATFSTKTQRPQEHGCSYNRAWHRFLAMEEFICLTNLLTQQEAESWGHQLGKIRSSGR